MENLNEMFAVSPAVIVAAPIVLGLVQVLKVSGLPSRFAPVASIAIGVSILLLGGLTLQVAIVQGIIAGLVASGLFSGGKSLLSTGG